MVKPLDNASGWSKQWCKQGVQGWGGVRDDVMREFEGIEKGMATPLRHTWNAELLCSVRFLGA